MTLPSAPEIIAHRGSSDDAPENTLAAVNLAWKRAADAVEIDVHLTKDGKLVVLHDEDIKRTTGVSGLIGHLTLEQISSLDAGSWKHPSYAGERIPRLDEILASGPSKKRFFIEIKGGAEVVKELQACLQRAALRPEQAVIISFDFAAVATAKDHLPHHAALWIVSHHRRPGAIETIAQRAKAAGLDGLDLARQWPIDRTFVSHLEAEGLGVWVWTVNQAKRARQLAKAGVRGITTNRPGWLRTQLEL